MKVLVVTIATFAKMRGYLSVFPGKTTFKEKPYANAYKLHTQIDVRKSPIIDKQLFKYFRYSGNSTIKNIYKYE